MTILAAAGACRSMRDRARAVRKTFKK